MRLDTEIVTSQGICKCTIQRKDNGIFEVDVWRFGTFLLSEITMFSACVQMQWNGDRYAIIRTKPDKYVNAYWLELENTISTLIMINE